MTALMLKPSAPLIPMMMSLPLPLALPHNSLLGDDQRKSSSISRGSSESSGSSGSSSGSSGAGSGAGSSAMSSMGTGSLPPKKKLKMAADFENVRPIRFVIETFQENGTSPKQVVSTAASRYLKPTAKLAESYTMEATMAVRENDVDALRALYQSGAVLDCCNRFGNSLLHIACRRGHTQMVRYLLEEVGVSVHFLDDTRRFPLHDALWTPEPNFEIVELLLRKAPEHVLCPDMRGATPFDYARKSHWKQWLVFLSERKHLFRLSEQQVTQQRKRSNSNSIATQAA